MPTKEVKRNQIEKEKIHSEGEKNMNKIKLASQDQKDLQEAFNCLEHPSLSFKVLNTACKPIEYSLKLLPTAVDKRLSQLAHKAMDYATDAALFTMSKQPTKTAHNAWHRVTVAVSGGIGGFFGLPGATAELPVSTTVMVRSILDVARSEGADITSPQVRLDALQVFGLDTKSSKNLEDTAYYTARASMAYELHQASAFLAKSGSKLTSKKAPQILQFMQKVAARFGVTLSEKEAAQSIPFIGAAFGALINERFLSHFQQMARGHFIIRRLEEKYDPQTVQKAYTNLKACC